MVRGVVFALGREPSPLSLLPAVLAGLRDRGHVATAWLVDPATAGVVLSEADLIVPRSVGPETVALLAGWAGPSASWCNSPAAVSVAADRITAWQRLAQAGVPVPPGEVVAAAAAVRERTAQRATVVKAARGSRGQGVAVLGRGARVELTGAGPWLVQHRLPGDGWDRKLYVVGPQVRGRRRRWPPRSAVDKQGEPLQVTGELAELARAAAAALGMCVCGVDVVPGPAGPAVVDVNVLPGFKGVPDAVPLLVGHYSQHLTDRL